LTDRVSTILLDTPPIHQLYIADVSLSPIQHNGLGITPHRHKLAFYRVAISNYKGNYLVNCLIINKELATFFQLAGSAKKSSASSCTVKWQIVIGNIN